MRISITTFRADVDAKDNDGDTALDLAKGKPEFESILKAAANK